LISRFLLTEERICFTDLEENFTYSLAACYRGLFDAYVLFGEKKWNAVACQMKEKIMQNSAVNFYRSFGKINDLRMDASLLGLVWPFRFVDASDIKMKETLIRIESELVKDYRIFRYENDEYDGWMYRKNMHRRKGAGYWPLLNFWMSIYYSKSGNRSQSLKYYEAVLNDLEDDFIPEQIFNNNIQFDNKTNITIMILILHNLLHNYC